MNINNIYSSIYNIDKTKDKQIINEEIVAFIHKILEEHAVKLNEIGFMGTLYSMNHIIVPVPGLVELSFGRLCSKINDRFISGSPQRLLLVDEYQDGMQKLSETFLATGAKSGIIGWYGENEFEIKLISS